MFIKSLFLAVITLLLDQWSKWYFFALVDEAGSEIVVTPFFNVVKVYNTGMSFGILSGQAYSTVLLTAIGVAITLTLGWWLWHNTRAVVAWALGCIIGGAIGNIIDRIRIGAVADFLDFHAYGYHWPAFNVADSAIFIGAVLLCWDAFTQPNSAPKTKGDALS